MLSPILKPTLSLRTLQKMPAVKVRASKSVAYTPYDARWMPGSARVVAMGGSARGTGIVQVLEASGDQLAVVAEGERPAAIKCATPHCAPSGARHIAVGDFQGRLCVLDPVRIAAGPVFSATAVQGRGTAAAVLNAIDSFGPEIATGGRDGRACVWDPRVCGDHGPVAEVPARHKDSAVGFCEDCWAVALGNSHSGDDGGARCLCAAFDSGRVSLYDLRAAGTPLFERPTGKGVCGVAFDRADVPMNRLLTAGLDARLCAYDLRSPAVSVFAEAAACSSSSSSAHCCPTAWFVRPLPQNRAIFACGTGAGCFGVWKCEGSGSGEDASTGQLVQIAEEEVSTQPIVSADWNADLASLAVAAVLDQTIKLVIVPGLAKLC